MQIGIGTHRARLVALGCSQVSGIDFSENFTSPMMSHSE